MLEILTALAVSIDAYFAGFSYALSNKPNLLSVVCVTITTFVCCIAALLLSVALSSYSLFFRIGGGVVFIGLGVRNLFPRKSEQSASSIGALSLGVSADAALACLSILAFGVQIPLYAAMFAIFHAVCLVIGFCCAKLFGVARWITVVSGLTLIVLGVKKFF